MDLVHTWLQQRLQLGADRATWPAAEGSAHITNWQEPPPAETFKQLLLVLWNAVSLHVLSAMPASMCNCALFGRCVCLTHVRWLLLCYRLHIFCRPSY